MVGGKRWQNLCCAKAGNKIEVVRRQNFRVFGDVGKGQRHVLHELRGGAKRPRERGLEFCHPQRSHRVSGRLPRTRDASSLALERK